MGSLINDLFNSTRNLLQKRDRGMVSVDEFNDAVRYAQTKLVRETFDFINNIKNSKKFGKVSRLHYDKEVYYKSIQKKILVAKTLDYNGSSETFNVPDDYNFYESLWFGDAEITEIDNGERVMIKHPDIAPSEMYPIFLIHGYGIEVIPDTISDKVKMYYYRNPKTPKFTYQSLGGGQILFDPSKSDYQDIELPESVFDLLQVEIAIYLGVQLKMTDVVQIMEKEDSINEQLKRA